MSRWWRIAADSVARVGEQVTAWSHALIARTLLLMLLGCAVVGGTAFIAIGTYLSLSEALTAWAAGLIVGGAILILSLIVAWIAWLYTRKPKQPQAPNQPPAQSAEAQAMVDTAAHRGEVVGASLSKSGIRTTDVMIAALVAGTILGGSPALRNRLLRRRRNDSYSKKPPQ